MRKLDIPAYKIQAVSAGSQGHCFQIRGLFSGATGNVKCEARGQTGTWEVYINTELHGEGVDIWPPVEREKSRLDSS